MTAAETERALRIEEARTRKVARLLAAAREHGITAGQAERLDDDGRRALAGLAGVNPPSETSWARVVVALRTMPDPPADPFEGLTP